MKSIKQGGLHFENEGDVMLGNVTLNNFYGTQEKNEQNLMDSVRAIYDAYSVSLKQQPILVQALQFYLPLEGVSLPSHDAGYSQEMRRSSLYDRWVLPFLENQGSFEGQPLLLLLGDSGAGKSTFAHYLTIACWEDYYLDKPNLSRVPILIELKGLTLKPGSKNLGFFLDDLLQKAPYNLTQSQIKELQTLPVLFVFDGFDELPGEPYNIYNENDLKHWNAKVLITCRSNYLGELPNYPLYFSSKGSFSCQEVSVAPLAIDQVQSYVQKYFTSQFQDKLHLIRYLTSIYKAQSKEYQNIKIEAIALKLLQKLQSQTDLYQIVQNPLMLQMVVRTWPYLISKNIELLSMDGDEFDWRQRKKKLKVMYVPQFTRTQVYDGFFHAWFERESARLFEKTGSTKIKLWDFKSVIHQKAFQRFCEDLAWEMFCSGEVAVQLPELELDDFSLEDDSFEERHVWEKFFTDEDPNIVNIRMGCPLVMVDGKYSFYHKSFMEYFAAKALYRELFSPLRSGWSNEKLIRALRTNKLKINHKLLRGEQDVIAYFAQLLEADMVKIDRLLDVVYASRDDCLGEFASKAAANAMMVLKAAFFNFVGLDLSGINIPHADMRGAYCDRANFQGANLSHVLFAQAWLHNVNARGAKLTGVDFGEWPYFDHDGVVLDTILRKEIGVLVVANNNNVVVWDFNRFVQIKQLSFHEDVVTCLALSSDNRVLVTGGEDCRVVIWGFEPGTVVNVLEKADDVITSVAISADGRFVAYASKDKWVRVYDAQLNKYLLMEKHTDEVYAVAISDNGNIVLSAGADGCLYRWDLLGGCCELVSTLDDTITCVDVSSDGFLGLAGTRRGHLYLWDFKHEKSQQFVGHHLAVTDVALSRDASFVVSGSLDNTIRKIYLSTGKSEVLYGNTFSVSAISLCEDGLLVASAGRTGAVRLFNLMSAENIAVSWNQYIQWKPPEAIKQNSAPKWDRRQTSMFGRRGRGKSAFINSFHNQLVPVATPPARVWDVDTHCMKEFVKYKSFHGASQEWRIIEGNEVLVYSSVYPNNKLVIDKFDARGAIGLSLQNQKLIQFRDGYYLDSDKKKDTMSPLCFFDAPGFDFGEDSQSPMMQEVLAGRSVPLYFFDTFGVPEDARERYCIAMERLLPPDLEDAEEDGSDEKVDQKFF